MGQRSLGPDSSINLLVWIRTLGMVNELRANKWSEQHAHNSADKRPGMDDVRSGARAVK
jgi:hypothetical protein